MRKKNPLWLCNSVWISKNWFRYYIYKVAACSTCMSESRYNKCNLILWITNNKHVLHVYLHKESVLFSSIQGVRILTSNLIHRPSPVWHRLYHPMECWNLSRDIDRNWRTSRWIHLSICMKVLVLRSHAPSQSKHRRPFYSTRYKTGIVTSSGLSGRARSFTESCREDPRSCDWEIGCHYLSGDVQ